MLNLQYAKRNTEHFQPRLAEKLDGAFFASVEDGTVRIDYAAILAYISNRTRNPRRLDPKPGFRACPRGDWMPAMGPILRRADGRK
ncbi:MAG: hypothetical protein U1D30_00240 [Planctomycetota bacterium]